MRAIALTVLMSFSPALVIGAARSVQQSTVYTCSMHPEVQSSQPGKCPKCEMKLVPQSETTPPAKNTRPASAEAGSEAYTCSMHPEIRTAAPGKCPKCAMTLIPIVPAIGEDFDLRVECFPQSPRPNQKVRLRFAVFNPKTGRQARDFQIMHEQLFHLFVVSQDLSEFQHIHPEFNQDGTFTIETVLPRAGRYKLYADFYPSEGTPQVLQTSIVTAGYKSDLFGSRARIEPDTTLTKIVDGMKIELTLTPGEIIAGQPVTLKYHLRDAASGEPVRDLQPYLAAWGHTLILSDDQSDYVHSHPEEVVPETPDTSKLRGGPDVTFNAFMPRPGMYRVWTQFLRGKTLTTVSFTIRAKRLG